MTIVIFDPTVGSGTLGSAVPASTKRKFTKCTAYNGTGATVSIKIYLIPDTRSADVSTTFVDYDLADRETYNCPEVVGQGLGPGGLIETLGAGITFSAMATDTLNN